MRGCVYRTIDDVCMKRTTNTTNIAYCQSPCAIQEPEDEETLRKMNEAEIFAHAIDKWGAQAQVMMVYEEMAELQKELCKNWRGKDNIEQIADEVADVEIMLDQLKMIYEIKEKVREHRAFKIARLRQRLEG